MAIHADAPDAGMATHADAPLEPGAKRVWIIRHAESENNVSKRTAKIAWRALKSDGRLPSREQWGALAPMLALPMDTPLSAAGRAQITAQRARLDSARFHGASGIALIVHSPLSRARATWSVAQHRHYLSVCIGRSLPRIAIA